MESQGKSPKKKTGKVREFPTNVIHYFLVIFKWTVYYLLFVKMDQVLDLEKN